MGPTSLSFILAVQHTVSWGQRGVATGAVIFLRTIGGAIGVGLLGATLGWGLAHRLARAGATGIDVVAALRPETHEVLSMRPACTGSGEPGPHAPRRLSSDDDSGPWLPGVCASGCPTSDATLTHSRSHEREVAEDEGLAVAASEF